MRMRMMRVARAALLCSLGMLWVAGSVSAYGLRLHGPPLLAGPIPGPGNFVEYDLFLDVPVNEGIVLFSVSVTFDPNVIAYRQDLSVSNDYYPLYAPASGKTPANWLNPNVGFGPDLYAPDGPGFDTWPAPPPGLAQINVDFLNPTFQPTTGTGTNVWLGSLVFEMVGPGNGLLNVSFDNGGNIFNVNGTDLSGQVAISYTPEPSTALLVGLGLVALARRTRRA